MMLIPCPWCGPRNQIEFTYGGDATLRRPAPDAPEAAWVDYVYLRDNPRGPHRRVVVARRRLPQLVQGRARYASRTRSSPARRQISVGRIAERRRHRGHAACAWPNGGRDRSRASARASASTALRYEGYRGRHARLGAARERRASRRPQLQVSPPARHLQAGAEEPNALVQLGEGARTEPNIRATTVELFHGLVARSQNCWPSVPFDIGAVARFVSPLLPAGFYYKTFMAGPPSRAWLIYEPLIRRAAGMGTAPARPIPIATSTCTPIAMCW